MRRRNSRNFQTSTTNIFLGQGGIGANDSHLQPFAELRRTQTNVVKSNGVLKQPWPAAIRQLTSDHSVHFTEGGKPENPKKNPQSTEEFLFSSCSPKRSRTRMSSNF